MRVVLSFLSEFNDECRCVGKLKVFVKCNLNSNLAVREMTDNTPVQYCEQFFCTMHRSSTHCIFSLQGTMPFRVQLNDRIIYRVISKFAWSFLDCEQEVEGRAQGNLF